MAKGLQEKTGSNSSTFGFNGKEMDNDMGSGTGNVYDYGFRIYNPRIAKFLSVDPLTSKYPWYTPYQFAGNMPIWAIDLDGLEEVIVITGKWWQQTIKLEIASGNKRSARELAMLALTKEVSGEPSAFIANPEIGTPGNFQIIKYGPNPKDVFIYPLPGYSPTVEVDKKCLMWKRLNDGLAESANMRWEGMGYSLDFAIIAADIVTFPSGEALIGVAARRALWKTVLIGSAKDASQQFMAKGFQLSEIDWSDVAVSGAGSAFTKFKFGEKYIKALVDIKISDNQINVTVKSLEDARTEWKIRAVTGATKGYFNSLTNDEKHQYLLGLTEKIVRGQIQRAVDENQ